MVRRGIGVMLIAFAAGAYADTITVGKVTYEGVYIERDRNHYFIHLPEEGRVVKVSRKRQDVTPPIMEKDATLREALLRQFQENRPDPPREPVKVARGPLSNAAVEQHHRVRDLALFEAQLAHWRALSETQRIAVANMLLSNVTGEAGDLVNSAVAMGADTSKLQSRLNAAAKGEPPQAPSSPQVNGTVPRAPTSTASREPVYRPDRQDVLALVGQAFDGVMGIVGDAERIEKLNHALSQGYNPRLTPQEVGTWEGGNDHKTAPFSIEESFWRLDCIRDDFGQVGEFSITVYDAETNLPFTRLADVDYLQMRVRVLEGPGRFYLKIEQDESGIPYEIRAVTFSK